MPPVYEAAEEAVEEAVDDSSQDASAAAGQGDTVAEAETAEAPAVAEDAAEKKE